MEVHAVVFGDHLLDAGEGVPVGMACVNDDRLAEGDGSGELALEDSLLGGVGRWWAFVVVKAAFTPCYAGRVGHNCYDAVMYFVGVAHGVVGVAAYCKTVESVRPGVGGWVRESC